MTNEINTIYRSKSVRVADTLADDIQQGRFQAGMLLPTENELAGIYRVSGMTMRKALGILANRGVVVRLPQKGTLVPSRELSSPPPIEPSTASETSATSGMTISAVWAAEPDAHLVGISEGVKKYAREAGLHVQMILSPDGHERALDYLQHVENYSVQGVLTLPYGSEKYIQTLDRLKQQSFPLVCVDRQVGGREKEISSVEADNAAGEYWAVQYLIEKYRQPVFFFSCLTEHSTIQERYLGYRRAMSDAGFEKFIDGNSFFFDVSDSDPTYWPMEKKPQSAYAGAETFLSGMQFPACVVCVNDYAARGLYEVAEKRGLQIGRDLFVIGFDDHSVAKFLKPTMTTIRQPSLQIGYDATKLLHQIILGKVKSPVNIHLPVELVMRETA
jgi:DNA-binding LacI/PurR family transcriptional regulator